MNRFFKIIFSLVIIVLVNVSISLWEEYIKSSSFFHAENSYALFSLEKIAFEAGNFFSFTYEYIDLVNLCLILFCAYIFSFRGKLKTINNYFEKLLKHSTEKVAIQTANDIALKANYLFGKDPDNFINSVDTNQLQSVAKKAVSRMNGDHCGNDDSFYNYLLNSLGGYFKADMGHFSNVNKRIWIEYNPEVDSDAVMWKEKTFMKIHCPKFRNEQGGFVEFKYPVDTEYKFSSRGALEKEATYKLEISRGVDK